MIEIIRQEENEKKKRTLPKDIRQIGKTDAGDRIYIENQVYHFLHKPGQEEKSAHVLLGRFEEISGKCCVFIESAIRLTEMQFEGGLPLWTDRTWAYIYKHIKKEHDEMSIVGCAVDIRGQQPGMTVKLEAIHQKNFGGSHQVMLLMDTLEQEESFYGNYNGHLYKREGFYIYYDKNLPENISMSVHEAAEEIDQETAETMRETEKDDWETKRSAQEVQGNGHKNRKNRQKSYGKKSRREANENRQERKKNEWEFDETGQGIKRSEWEFDEAASEIKRSEWEFDETAQRMREDEWESEKDGQERRRHGWEPDEGEQETRRAERDADEEEQGQRRDEWEPRPEPRPTQSSRYRERLKTRPKKRPAVSYAPTVALAALVCLMGAAALQNQRKVNEMQSSVSYNNSEASAKDRQEEPENNVVIETVGGNVLPQENAGEDIAVAENTENITNETQSPEVGIENPDDMAVAEGGDPAANAPEPTENTPETQAESETVEPPATETMAADAVKTEAQIYLEQGYYIVQKGDNLAGICRKIYQTTAMMDKICELNKIEDKNAIYAGQYLVLPN